MNLTKAKPITLAVGILAVIFLVIVGILVFSSEKKQTPQEYKPSPLPTLKPVPLAQPSGFSKEKSKLESLLPYKGPDYSIEFHKSVNIIIVKIDAQSQEKFVQIKKEAEQFIKDKGVDNLCPLNIFWVSNKVKVDASLLITTGCPSIQKR